MKLVFYGDWLGISFCWTLQYTSLLHSGEHHAISSSTQATASLSSIASRDNSLSEMYCSPPRPLPYDAEHRYFHLQQNELVSGREKGSSHLHDSEPLQRSDSDDDMEFPSTGNKWDESCQKGSKEDYSKSSLNLSTTEPKTGFAHIYPSSEDEDVCPTCLEGIVLQYLYAFLLHLFSCMLCIFSIQNMMKKTQK